jgi:hypothetical protein
MSVGILQFSPAATSSRISSLCGPNIRICAMMGSFPLAHQRGTTHSTALDHQNTGRLQVLTPSMPHFVIHFACTFPEGGHSHSRLQSFVHCRSSLNVFERTHLGNQMTEGRPGSDTQSRIYKVFGGSRAMSLNSGMFEKMKQAAALNFVTSVWFIIFQTQQCGHFRGTNREAASVRS